MRRGRCNVVVTVVGFAAAAFAAPSFATNDLSLNVTPASECVSVGQTITVTLDVRNLSARINGVQVRLNYDDSLMTLVDVVPADLGLTPPASGWDEISQTDTNGNIDWAASINGGSILINHTVATLTFTAIADGTVDVFFRADSPPYYTKLTNANDSSTIYPTVHDTDEDYNADGTGSAFIGPPDCTITADNAVCAGTTGHVASVPEEVGGTYAWTVTGGTITAGQGTRSITYTAGTGASATINVTVTDANGCPSTCQKIVTINANPVCTITAASSVCANTTGHTASVPNAGVGAIYSWSITGGTITTGQGTNSITFSSGAGPSVTLNVTVTNANLCVSTCQKIIAVAAPDCTITAANEVCAGSTGNTATVPDAGTGATYTWVVTGGTLTGGQGTRSITYTAGTGASVTLDVNVVAGSCGSDCQKIVTVNPNPTANAGSDIAVCDNAASPTVGGSPTGSGGTGALSYLWSGSGATYLSSTTVANPTFNAVSAPAGSYQVCVTVTDSKSCAGAIDCATVTVNALPTANAGNDITLCADAADPTVGGSPTGSGGAGGYTFSWTGTGATYLNNRTVANPTFNVAAAGPGAFEVCVTVTDANLCASLIDCATITINALPTANAGNDITLCANAADPTVGAVPPGSGGTGPYTYLWSGSGAIYLSATNIANPTFDVSVAGAGSYQVCVTVTDANLCASLIDCATITINALPAANAGADLALCANASDPTVGGSPTGSGGTEPYTYLWSGTGSGYLSSMTAANPTFDVSVAGVGSFQICVTVTDSKGCVSLTDCAGITINLVLDCSITTDNPVCAGTTHAASVASAGGGATYAWTVTGGTLNSGQNSNSISYTAGAGPTVTISVIVTDINNCTNTCQRVVTVNSNPTANAGPDIARCADAADPAVGGSPTGSGGSGTYTYLWTGTGAGYLSSTTIANPTFDVSAAAPGSYQACVTVTDTNSCVSATDCATVTIRALPVANAGNDITLCANATNPQVGGSPTGSGGTTPYTYLWSGTGVPYLSSSGVSNPIFNVAAAGPGTWEVCVTVTDANLCVSAIDCATITINPLPVGNAGNDITLCADAANPTVGGSPTGSGGTPSYTYLWTGTGAAYLSSTTEANPTFNVAAAGVGTKTVCVTVTDSKGCASLTDCANVTVNALPSCTITSENLVCWGTSGHSASAPAGAVTYVWGITGGTINSGQGTNSISYTAGAGPNLTLTVTVTNASSCVSTCQKVVTVDHPDCTISADDAVCYLSTGNLATAPAGMSSYVWTVTGGTRTGQNANSITYTAGSGTSLTLQVTVTNSNGCVSTCQKVVNIIQPSLNATLQLEAVSNVVTRDVTFVITDCTGATDTRTLPVTTNASGVGTATISSIAAGADWVSVREGHTLRRLQTISFGACYAAAIDLTASGSGRPLLAGDFRTGVVTQDNLVDITDFSILASRWNQTIDRNLGTGADATGDGVQNTADFTAIQVNFFEVGEDSEGCPKVATDDGGLRPVEAEPVPVIAPRSSVPVSNLGFASASKADLNGDGLIDTRDIRAFARQNGLTLLPEFSEKLDKLESGKARPQRGR